MKPRQPSPFEPLRIRAVLAGKLLGHDLPRLDAVLEYRAAQSAGMDVHAPPQELQPCSIEIPLARREVAGFRWPIPLCSDPIVGTCRTDGHNFIAKRFPTERAGNLHSSRRLTINTTGGPFKSYLMPIRARQFDAIVWFCVGDAEKIRELLAGVHVLGKKRQVGGAMVARWEVEPADADLSWFAPSEMGTVLMRTLPASGAMPDDLVGFRKHFGSAVAPYWSRSWYCELVAPC